MQQILSYIVLFSSLASFLIGKENNAFYFLFFGFGILIVDLLEKIVKK